MNSSQLRYRVEWFAQQAKIIAKSTANGNHSFAAEEQPRLDQARADVIDVLPAADRKDAGEKLDSIAACADIIEQRRFAAFNARRPAEQMRLNAEADLQEAEIERLTVEISGHLGHR